MRSKSDRPKHVLIPPYKFRFVEDDKLSEAAGVLGAAMSDQEVILLDPDQGYNVMRDTVLHEILHVLIRMTDARKLGLTEDMEESLIENIAPHLLNLLRVNPELLEWLTT